MKLREVFVIASALGRLRKVVIVLTIISAIFSGFMLCYLFDCKWEFEEMFFRIAVFTLVCIPVIFAFLVVMLRVVEREIDMDKKFLYSLIREVEEGKTEKTSKVGEDRD